MDIYSIGFDPNKLSYQHEELGMRFADLDTAVELMKKEEKMIIAELTIYYSKKANYKNMTELNGLIVSKTILHPGKETGGHNHEGQKYDRIKWFNLF